MEGGVPGVVPRVHVRAFGYYHRHRVRRRLETHGDGEGGVAVVVAGADVRRRKHRVEGVGSERDRHRQGALAPAVHEEYIGARVEEGLRVIVALDPERDVEGRVSGRVLGVYRGLGGEEGADHLDGITYLDGNVERRVAVSVLERRIRPVLEE